VQGDHVTLRWLMGLLLMIPGFQMLAGHPFPKFPRRIADHPLPTWPRL
jgi:hypothetical protein